MVMGDSFIMDLMQPLQICYDTEFSIIHNQTYIECSPKLTYSLILYLGFQINENKITLITGSLSREISSTLLI